ncbi:MAG: hypothetical protein UV32_C0003G0014 [Candidatus Collierbacteria bacterium GW2011_GWF2_42_51]|nr:MAG: hypothetical protein UV32_C0003G0014 [Candidatus Collierbacteria bacterium GW2011_GWF2_42_51]
MNPSNNSNNNRGRGDRPQQDGFEQVLQIRRVSKKTQGGSNVSFSALVVTPKPQTLPMLSKKPFVSVIVTSFRFLW